MSGFVNFLLYQTGWFCCVLGAAHGRPWLGSLAAAALLGVHLALVPRPLDEWKVLATAGMLGLVVDSALSGAGLLAFRSGHVTEVLAPPWILLLWMQFATLFRFGLRFLRRRYALAALLAAFGGPLAFWAGSRLGAVELAEPPIRSLVALAVVWSAALPFLLRVSARWIPGDVPASYRLCIPLTKAIRGK